MAKTQNLSLNPTKISGTCGRLMCCLKYEQEAYEDLLRHAPKADSFVDTPEGRGTIVDVNLLRQRVKVRLEKEPDTIVTCSNEEIAVFRSGKAKKTDPPIPEDWAPISGAGTKTRREEPEKRAFLDPIMFFDTKQPAAEPAEQVAEVPAEEKEESSKRNRHRNRNRNRHRGENKEEAAPAAPAEQPVEPAPAPEAPAGEGKKNNHRRHNRYRHHRPKQNSAE